MTEKKFLSNRLAGQNAPSRTLRARTDEFLLILEETLAAGGEVFFTPNGGSMRPFFQSGQTPVLLSRPDDWIRSTENGPVCHPRVRLGDVVLYQKKAKNGVRLILHRVVGRNRRGLILCGDGLTKREYGISPESVVACVRGFYRGKRFIDCRANVRYRLAVRLWLLLRPGRRLLLPFFSRRTSRRLETDGATG